MGDKTWPMIRVGVQTFYVGPKTPKSEEAMKAHLTADLEKWTEWLTLDVEDAPPSLTGEVPEWLWEDLMEPCPHIDDPDHNSCIVCEGEGEYVPGWEPIDDGEPSECSHEPDAHTIAFASQTDLICDVSCGKCGMSGSFRVDPTSIQWEDQ